ncbi:MAG: hypothetical protein IKY10_02015, partial [Clostridia bacterium]|nr:hypothetical protein [Clostridia bacterium]
MKKLKVFILMICLFVPFSFVGCQNKNKETLSTPAIVDIRSGTVIFSPVKNADYYTLSINDFSVSVDAKSNNKIEIIDNQINFDASNIFVVGNSYSIKIQANAHGKNSSKFSQTFSYKHNGNISKPKNLKINGNILTWDMVENATYYLVKVITPNDEILFDKDGNILEGSDGDSIEQADLTEYCFNTNQFDFTSVLNTAGNYKFYVSAVSSNGTNYVESGYATTSPYSHYVTLSTPTNGVVKKIGSSLHMLTKIDDNANAILIECNGFEKTLELNNASTCITSVNENYFDINLTQFFQGETFNQFDINTLAHFAFRTKSAYVTGNVENLFYQNSNFSDYVYYDNTYVLQAPTLEIEKDSINDCYLVSWSCPDNALASEYTLLLCTASGIKKFYLEANVESKLIYDDFISIAIQANGVGNYESSTLSNFVSNPTFANQPSSLNCSLSDSRLTWNSIADAYYIVEFAGEYFVTNT